MNCPKCSNQLTSHDYCSECGEDIRLYKKIIRYSNAYYNEGLEKAKLRDLTGAIQSLSKSLRFDKKNIEARNLLGLIYYEMGEVVNALSEWVISVNLKTGSNPASTYIKNIQSNPTKLETINTTIKKYNQALIQAKSGSYDLAILQLKKVLSLNSNFLRAYHLLSLLYIRSKDYEKAKKLLLKANKIDINNTTTLRYLKEIGVDNVNEERPVVKRESVRQSSSISDNNDTNKTVSKVNHPIEPIGAYKEDKPNIMLFVNLVIGIFIGVAVLYFLVVPNTIKSIEAESTSIKLQLSEELASRNATISTLESKISSQEAKITSLEKEIKGEEEVVETTTEISVEPDYEELIVAISDHLGGDNKQVAFDLLEVNPDSLILEKAKKIYTDLVEETFLTASTEWYNSGHDHYSSGKYEEAIEEFNMALKFDDKNADAIYFLGRAYDRLGNTDEAKNYYDKIINEFPESSRLAEAKSKRNALGD